MTVVIVMDVDTIQQLSGADVGVDLHKARVLAEEGRG